MVFSSVFEADFAEITAQFAVEASPEVSLRWEKAVIRLVGLLQKFLTWAGCAAICIRRKSGLSG